VPAPIARRFSGPVALQRGFRRRARVGIAFIAVSTAVSSDLAFNHLADASFVREVRAMVLSDRPRSGAADALQAFLPSFDWSGRPCLRKQVSSDD